MFNILNSKSSLLQTEERRKTDVKAQTSKKSSIFFSKNSVEI